MKADKVKYILQVCYKFKVRVKGDKILFVYDRAFHQIGFYIDHFEIRTPSSLVSILYADVIKIEITE